MKEVYISRKIFNQALEILKNEEIGFEMNELDVPLSKPELIEKIRDVNGLICLLTDWIDVEILEASPRLKAISNIAAGFDNIDVNTAPERGILVTNTPDVLTDTTADLAFALLMSAARRIPEADRFTRAGKYNGWELMHPHLGLDIYGKTLGIIGMGRIGTAVAKRGHRGFDMKILYYVERRNEAAEQELDAEYVSFDELLERSDFITVHVPLTEKTRHMFNMEAFEKMKNNAILVNTSRGPVVDEKALAQALKAGEIKGAALDVYEGEPKIHPELVKLEEHVVLVPHIGSASVETRIKMAVMAAENMVAALKGEEPPNLVNQEALKSQSREGKAEVKMR
ncbi:MAG: 2-hydroxyacid dehydrogenase [Candidatus Bipolaricaulia bacterium]